jgi:PAS domain S-box-containing protein
MALVDPDLRYVAVNDAMIELYQYRRDDMIGSLAGTGLAGEESSTSAEEWQELLRTGELYGERVVAHGSGAPMRVATQPMEPGSTDGGWRCSPRSRPSSSPTGTS